ncbi:MAG: hypothetical protein LWX56_05910 [Ignavibacteria bacterium]|nr:hypothetical protein [Ignavibacteria bacterium]
MQKTIVFYKVRSVSEVTNITVEALKAIYKPLYKAIFIYALPFFAVSAYLSIQLNELQQANEIGFFLASFLSYVLHLLPAFISSIIVYSILDIYHSDYEGEISTTLVFEKMKQMAPRFIRSYLFIYLIVCVSVVLLVVPMIYFSILSPYFLLLCWHKNESLTESLKSTRKLIKGDWWAAFGLLIIVSIVIGIISMAILSIPTIIFSITVFAKMGTKDLAANNSVFQFVVYLSQFMALFLTPIAIISTWYFYGSLIEKKEGKDLLTRIESME